MNEYLPLAEPKTIDIPLGLGQVINPDGSISEATQAVLVPDGTGNNFVTGYPIT